MQISITESELDKSLGERTAETDTRVVRIHCMGAIRAAKGCQTLFVRSQTSSFPWRTK